MQLLSNSNGGLSLEHPQGVGIVGIVGIVGTVGIVGAVPSPDQPHYASN